MKIFADIIIFALKVGIAAIAPMALIRNMDFLLALMAAISVIIAVWPRWFLRKKGYKMPLYVDFMIALALFIHNWACYWGWWGIIPNFDKIMHAYGSAVIGLVSFFLIFSLNMIGKLRLGLWGHIWMTAILTLAMGAFWEIGEYIIDGALRLNSQHGNNDTMTDLIFDAIAGFIVPVIAGVSLKFVPAHRIERHFSPFVHYLEWLFGHHRKVRTKKQSKKEEDIWDATEYLPPKEHYQQQSNPVPFPKAENNDFWGNPNQDKTQGGSSVDSIG